MINVINCIDFITFFFSDFIFFRISRTLFTYLLHPPLGSDNSFSNLLFPRMFVLDSLFLCLEIWDHSESRIAQMFKKGITTATNRNIYFILLSHYFQNDTIWSRNLLFMNANIIFSFSAIIFCSHASSILSACFSRISPTLTNLTFSIKRLQLPFVTLKVKVHHTFHVLHLTMIYAVDAKMHESLTFSYSRVQ